MKYFASFFKLHFTGPYDYYKGIKILICYLLTLSRLRTESILQLFHFNLFPVFASLNNWNH